MNTILKSTILEALEADHGQMQQWFEHMHRHPELSMREHNTAKYIAEIVGQWGYEVETGIGKHGIVASMMGCCDGRPYLASS